MQTTSMVGIFNDLKAIREEKNQARQKVAIYIYNKNGKIRQEPFVTCENEEQATKRLGEVQQLNPGRKFEIKAL
jgi:hypothetical protein